MLDEEKLEQRITYADESSAKEIIESLLTLDRIGTKNEIDRIDLKGREYLKHGFFGLALIKKTLAGRGYELLSMPFEAGFSFDRGAQAIFYFNWPRIVLLLNERAFRNHLKTDNQKNKIFSASRVASDYLDLDKEEKAREFLTKAYELASKSNYNLLGCSPFIKINRELGNIYVLT